MTAAVIEIPPSPVPPLPVAISECLTGSAVRYDGTDARSSFPHDALGELLSLVSICPEVGIGMTVPRPPIRLVGDPRAPRVRGVQDPTVDVTDALEDYAGDRSAQLDAVCGYVFMERSPSCGLYSVPVHAPGGGEPVSRHGRGAFARSVLSLYPQLPVEENGRLFDAGVRESFLARVFAYAHWRRLCAAGLTAARLMEFHSRYKYLLMAHSIRHYREAGRLLGERKGEAWHVQDRARSPAGESSRLDDVGERYLGCLLDGLGKPATRGGHANVLAHLQGYLSGCLDRADRRHLVGVIESFRLGKVALEAPRRILLRLLTEHPNIYLVNQVYLRPPWVIRQVADCGAGPGP